MAINKTTEIKRNKETSKPTNEEKIKAIIQMINIQRDTNMTRIYSAILPSR